MSDKTMLNGICLKIGNETGTFYDKFQSTEGEEYLVKIHIPRANTKDVRITLDWKNCLNLFIRVTAYNELSASYSLRKTIVVNSGRCASVVVPFDHMTLNSILFINITQCRLLRSCDHSPPTSSCEYSTVVQQKREPVVGEKLEQLSRSMKSLLETGYLSDVIISDGTNEILGHKLILSARSPVFARMFQHEMKETLENVLTIKDISIDVLKKLFEFMYTGRLEIKEMKTAFDLYVAGDKYDMKDLKEICSKMLMDVDLSNVLQVIILADLHHDEPLKEAAVNFLFENYSQVRDLESWVDFLEENKALAIEILSFGMEKRIEERIRAE